MKEIHVNPVPGWEYTAVALGSIRPTGWLLSQLESDADGITGRLPELTPRAAQDLFVRKTAKSDGRRNWWDGEVEGNWFDGFVRLAHVLGEPGLKKRAIEQTSRLLAGQDADGYLGIYERGSRHKPDGPNGELFCQSRILLALLAQHDATGDEQLLDAVRRGADHLADQYLPAGRMRVEATMFDTGPDDDGGRGHGVSIVEPLVKLHVVTGEDRFLSLAQFFYEEYSRSTVLRHGADCKLTNLLDEDVPLSGHGVHTCESLRLPLLLAAATRSKRYKEAFWSGYQKLVRHLTMSGAIKSDEHIGVPGAPLPTLGYEYCTVAELLTTLIEGARITGSLELADRAELLAYNAAQAARYASGTGVAYLSADNVFCASHERGAKWKYSPTHEDAAVCCAANFGRVLPTFVSSMLAHTSAGGLAILFYGPCTAQVQVGGVDLTLEQRTSYPFSESVDIQVELAASVEFVLRLRIPAWSKTASVHTHGSRASVTVRDRYIEVSRQWISGDTVTLQFVPELCAVRAVDGTVALRRGPLVYSLPIPDRQTVIRTYPIEGFGDVDHEPTQDAEWEYTLLTRRDEPLASAIGDPPADLFDPWSESPVRLQTLALNTAYAGIQPADAVANVGARERAHDQTMIDLVPMGSTILRRTCFPAVDIQESANVDL